MSRFSVCTCCSNDLPPQFATVRLTDEHARQTDVPLCPECAGDKLTKALEPIHPDEALAFLEE
jgi:hypothetical protein